MTPEEELEKQADLESAKLEVAESAGWAIAILSGVVANLWWRLGWWAVAVALFVYFAVTYPYRQREAAATDTYHRAAGLGKYAKTSQS